jgi:hypothetical protein
MTDLNFSTILGDIGSGMGSFLSAISMPLGYLILVLGIIGGVVSFFMAIAAVIRKAIK